VQKTILVAEDNPDAREMLSFILAGEGFSVITAEDGQQALNLIGRAPPDLIITDIQMPNLNGIELIKRLRAQSHLNRVPIVVMSAVGSGVVSEAINAGANQSTPKPMQLEALLDLIRQLLF
jgi:CheY-like chemotaxis protein